MNKYLKYIKRYGLRCTIRAFLRKNGIGELDLYKTNIPLMNRCKKMSNDEYPVALCEWYERSFARKLDLKNPKLFTEKIQWLKLFTNCAAS